MAIPYERRCKFWKQYNKTSGYKRGKCVCICLRIYTGFPLPGVWFGKHSESKSSVEQCCLKPFLTVTAVNRSFWPKQKEIFRFGQKKCKNKIKTNSLSLWPTQRIHILTVSYFGQIKNREVYTGTDRYDINH